MFLRQIPVTGLGGLLVELTNGGGRIRNLTRSGTESMVYRPLRYEQIMQAADAYEVRARRMFGGMGVYAGEKMFAFLVGEEIAFKLAPSDFEEAMALPGSGEMRPEPDADPMREYVKMPKSVLDNAEEFSKWLERSAEYVRNRAARLA